MPYAHNGPVELFYEQWGPSDGIPLLLVNGLSSQMISWDDSLMQAFVDHGFTTVRYDNRDVGESTWFDDDPVDVDATMARFFAGESIEVPYAIEDMADDAAAVLDALGWRSAHILGVSMGGMIVQAFAIRYPEKTRSLVSIMSTTGDPDVGQPSQSAAEALLRPTADGRDAAIEASVEVGRIISSPIHFDEAVERERAARAFDRANNPDGVVRQLFAVLTQQPRSDALRRLDVPALVVHGALDPLVAPSGGRRTHEALAGSELLELPEAGHDIPEIYRADLVDRVAELAARADARRGEAVAS